MKQNTSDTGKKGESKAVEFLKKNRYKILTTNYRSKFGEIDIIAEDCDQIIVFVEVKTRSSNLFGTPAESITRSKIEKIRRTIDYYLQKTSDEKKPYRIDEIEIHGETVNHLKNITL